MATKPRLDVIIIAYLTQHGPTEARKVVEDVHAITQLPEFQIKGEIAGLLATGRIETIKQPRTITFQGKTATVNVSLLAIARKRTNRKK